MQLKHISSNQNPEIKRLLQLRERRERDEAKQFLIEGYRELKRALDAGQSLDALFYCPEFFLGDNEGALLEQSRASLIRCAPQVFEKISYRDRPDGLLGVARQWRLSLQDLKLSHNPLLVMGERIEKPGNLGTILRSCDAAKVDACIVCDPTTDIYNPNVVRASVGTLFTLPVLEADPAETLSFLKQQRIALVAATPHAELEYTQADLRGPLAIAVGSEQYGLSDLWLSSANIRVRIPMLGIADSLNVASATTLLLYEALRQRR